MSRVELLRHLGRLRPDVTAARRLAVVRELRFLVRCGLGPDEVVSLRPDLTDILVAVMTEFMVESIEGRFIKRGETLAAGRKLAIDEAMTALKNGGIASVKALAPIASQVSSDSFSKAVCRELEEMSRRS